MMRMIPEAGIASLDLSGIGLTRVPDMFGTVGQELTQLNMGNNDLHSLPSEVGGKHH